MSDNEAKLRAAFQQALHCPLETNFETLAYREFKAWDSVAHMQLVTAIESAFDVMLEIDDILGLSHYPKAREILGRHGISF